MNEVDIVVVLRELLTRSYYVSDGRVYDGLISHYIRSNGSTLSTCETYLARWTREEIDAVIAQAERFKQPTLVEAEAEAERAWAKFARAVQNRECLTGSEWDALHRNCDAAREAVKLAKLPHREALLRVLRAGRGTE